MTTRTCHHDTTVSHVDGETICDMCETVVGYDKDQFMRNIHQIAEEWKPQLDWLADH